MTGSKQAVGYLVLVFLLGGALGVGGGYWFASNEQVEASKKQKGSKKPSTVDWLIKELDLTPDQKTQFHGILDETRETYGSIRTEARPRYEEARRAGREKIRAILNEEQRAKFDELVRQLDEKEKKRREKRKK